MRQPAVSPAQDAVFLNIPYDSGFRTLYVAYIVGLVFLEFKPHATLGLPGGTRRLDKIFQEIQACPYSIHDLSRVEADRTPPFATPRFNMPFELGLAVGWAKMNPKNHMWFIFESKAYRVQKSLSDLNGSDPHIHDCQVKGVLRELNNAFVRTRNRPTIPEMMKAYRLVSRRQFEIAKAAGAKSLFEASAFQGLCYAAKVAADDVRRSG
ncbi:MAG TPA: hypothetical protein VG225_13680 [Terracidiphilus sp.]|nr:hypothetical protein [Terracidiphilus sp.]